MHGWLMHQPHRNAAVHGQTTRQTDMGTKKEQEVGLQREIDSSENDGFLLVSMLHLLHIKMETERHLVEETETPTGGPLTFWAAVGGGHL